MKIFQRIVAILRHPAATITGAVLSLGSLVGILTTVQSSMTQIAHAPKLTPGIVAATGQAEDWLGTAIVIGTALCTVGQSLIKPRSVVVVPPDDTPAKAA